MAPPGSASPSFYPLPSSPTLTTLDRFSLLPPDSTIEEDPSGHVPLWPLLDHLLLLPNTNPEQQQPVVTSWPALTALLDTIAVTVHGTAHPAGDYALLREAVASRFGTEARFLEAVWPRLAALALEMPALFPSAQIPILGRGGDGGGGSGDGGGGGGGACERVALSRRQAACLVVHQFLRTLVGPGWKDGEEGGGGVLHDFGVWYGSGGQRQPSAARAYLGALMGYFDEVVCGGAMDGEWVVEYALRSVGEEEFRGMLGRSGCPMGEVEVVVVDQYDLSPESLGMPGGAAVVSANKYVGFGQSATQEEIHVGSSPEACPAVLLTPPLRDDQVLVVRGAQAMANITGQRRDIKVEEMPLPDGGQKAWQERTMLFMDALELDMAAEGDVLPDLLPGNMEREIRKAYTAFSSGTFRQVRTGLWGCGAFCGDPGMKMLFLWLAASLADTKLVVTCGMADQRFAEELRSVAAMARSVLRDTADLRQLLDQAPVSLVRGQTLPWIITQLGRRET